MIRYNSAKNWKIKRIGRQARNLLLKQKETTVLSATSLIYLGEVYQYPAVTYTERHKIISNLKKIIWKI